MTAGYSLDPAGILATSFADSHDGLIVLRGVSFTSLCEHHLLPFTGTATVAYVPGETVVGLSKLARLVHCYAARLQIQERLTDAIADVSQWPTFQGYGPIPGIAEAVYEHRTDEMVDSRIRCTNTNGSTHTEVIYEWEPGERIVMVLQDFSPPLSR